MLFRKVGAEKEEGRLKEDSLSETLRVLEETAVGLGESTVQKKMFQNEMIHKHNKSHKRWGLCLKHSDQNVDRKHVTLLFSGTGTRGGRFGPDQSVANRLHHVNSKVNCASLELESHVA